MVNKLSDCSVTECEVWSISYQTLLVTLVELHVNENSNATLLTCNDLVKNGFVLLNDDNNKSCHGNKGMLYWFH